MKRKVLIISGITVYVVALSAVGRRLRQLTNDYQEAVIPDDVPPLPPLFRRAAMEWE